MTPFKYNPEVKPGDRIESVVPQFDFGAFGALRPHLGQVGNASFANSHEIGIQLDNWTNADSAKAWGYDPYGLDAAEREEQWVGLGDVRVTLLQRLFSAVYIHLLAVQQGRISANGTRCEYAGPAGRCAVGGLLDAVPLNSEAKRVTHSKVLAAVSRSVGANLSGDAPALVFLENAQNLHDAGLPLPRDALQLSEGARPAGYGSLTPGRRRYLWKRTLERFAKRNNLRIPDIKTETVASVLGKAAPALASDAEVHE